MNHASLFTGIGGFDLAAEWMGWRNVFQVEKDSFCQMVLTKNFPNAKRYKDVKEFTGNDYRGAIDILTGGFPCQPYSSAGKRKGKDDERHLWPEMLRVIRTIRPTYIVGENVFGLVTWNDGMVFEEVHIDLENEGYQVQAFVLPACAVNAPHRRDRVWFVANSNSNARQQKVNERTKHQQEGAEICTVIEANGFKRFTSNTGGQRWQEYNVTGITDREDINSRTIIENWYNWPTESPVCAPDDGLPSQLDGITFSKWCNSSIKAAGNAIVPQVAFQIFKAIQLYNDGLNPIV